MPREHPFDRYAAFTDVAVLKEWSAKPLRKSVRVNTLKCSVERFREWARERGWKLEPVPWCPEGFFIDRPVTPHPALSRGEREHEEREPLGKDLLHLIGGFYIQEAASMLPVELLDPQPGDVVLDMSAAPGSKTTQIAAKMARVTPSVVEGQHAHHASTTLSMTPSGVIIANDIQEHRLWTLKSSLHRSGVTNAIVTKKVGQWFGKHMTERFDRVLCDAPCTAQGTVRKDSDALRYCGLENIEKMARLQVQLLEAAIHAAKVGGRIVYSTCTLTPEENEGVVMRVLEKFAGKVEVVDPQKVELGTGHSALRGSGPRTGDWGLGKAIKDSFVVQRHFQGPCLAGRQASPEVLVPTLRLWPQTYDTEGFFCAVLEKRAPTREGEHMEWVPFQEERLSLSRQKGIATKLEDCYGTSFLADAEVLLRSGEQLFLTSEEIAEFPLPVKDYSVGIPFAKILADGLARRSLPSRLGRAEADGEGGRVRLSHEMATVRGTCATQARCSIDDEQLALLLEGKDAPGDSALRGDVLLLYKDFCIGRALAKDGMLKNNLPRWMVRD